MSARAHIECSQCGCRRQCVEAGGVRLCAVCCGELVRRHDSEALRAWTDHHAGCAPCQAATEEDDTRCTPGNALFEEWMETPTLENDE